MFRVIEIISDGLYASAPTRPQRCGKEAAGDAVNGAGLAGWLRSRFPTATGSHVEAETGIPAASVENWLQLRAKPSVDAFATLISVFGPSLMMACLWRPARWVERAAKAERMAEIDREIQRLAAERETMAHEQ